MQEDPDDRALLGRIAERLEHIRVLQVERDTRIASIHETVRDTRERVISLDAQAIPKRLDSHANHIGDLKTRVNKLETQGQGLFYVLSVLAGIAGSLLLSLFNRMMAKL